MKKRFTIKKDFLKQKMQGKVLYDSGKCHDFLMKKKLEKLTKFLVQFDAVHLW